MSFYFLLTRLYRCTSACWGSCVSTVHGRRAAPKAVLFASFCCLKAKGLGWLFFFPLMSVLSHGDSVGSVKDGPS